MAVAGIKSGIRSIFKKRPLLANCLVYGTLYTGAEFSQQLYTRKIAANPPKDFDYKALGRFAVYGTTIAPCILFRWYRWLDARFIGTAPLIVVQKLTLDQFVLTPPLIATFYIFMSVMERKSEVLEECRAKLIPTFVTSCVFWIPAQGINFIFVPPAARVVYVGACALIWVNILCWYKRRVYTTEEADN